MTEEQMWGALWAGIVGTAVVAESIALKTENEHAPLSYWLRRYIPARSFVGRAAFVIGAHVLWQHLYNQQKEASE